MIEAGAMAAVSLAFAEYALRLVGTTAVSPNALAIIAIVVLSEINFIGVKAGSRVLNVFVVLKVAALALLILVAWFQSGAPEWFTRARVDNTPSGALAFGAALIPILFAYGGWQTVNYVAEEMRDPVRDLPRSLLAGTIAVVAIYLLVNVAYLRTLGLDGLATTTTPAADTAGAWIGAHGERFVAAAIAISTFGFLNHAILAPTRVYYAMAADRLFIPALAQLHPKYRTPGNAIMLQSGLAILLLVLPGNYGDLLGTVVFADWIFFGLTVAGLFVLRPRFASAPGFTMPGYPWLPALFVLVAGVVVFSALREEPVRSLIGAGWIAAGIPVYYVFRRASTRTAASR
jgi:APA family basic amino acid/polyamine antiporter